MGKQEAIGAARQRRQTFRQADITRAIKAAKDAGMVVTRCEIGPDGSIVLTEAPTTPETDAFASWKAKREGRIEGRS